MTLNDLRKYSIRQQIRVRYRMANGMDCVVDPAGIARVPGLKSIPDFNLETEFKSAGEFFLEPAQGPAKRLSRAELEAATGGTAPPTAAHDEEE